MKLHEDLDSLMVREVRDGQLDETELGGFGAQRIMQFHVSNR